MVLHGEARTFTGRVHLSYFSEKTLVHLLKDKVGFTDIDVSTFVSGKDSILNHFQFRDPFGEETIEYLPEQFQEFLRDKEKVSILERALFDLGLGYKLKFFATK